MVSFKNNILSGYRGNKLKDECLSEYILARFIFDQTKKN